MDSYPQCISIIWVECIYSLNEFTGDIARPHKMLPDLFVFNVDLESFYMPMGCVKVIYNMNYYYYHHPRLLCRMQ